MLRRTLTLSLLSLAIASTCQAGDAIGIFTLAKTASGGARWDTVKGWHADGTASAGGMSGAFHVTVDARNGRSADAYALGPVEGADGFDGTQSWARDPGGEVAALDAPAAIRRAHNDAWVNAHGYWYPKAMPAAWGEVTSKVVDGHRYDVVVATPQGGDPVTLWFAADTHLLARVQEPQGSSVATTVYDDYRLVDGLRMPFRATVDVTDAAGRTDPRDHSEVRFDKVALNVAIADADFAMPKMTPTARIDDQAGTTTIPFDLVNNHIYVDGKIDGKPARFLVDTGGTNLLTPAAAKKFGLVGEGKLAGRGVGDEAVDLSLAHAKQVRVGNAVLAKPVFYVIDLGDLPKVEGVQADGLVGYEMFRRFGVEIDYANHRLVMSDPAKFVPPAGATAIPFQLDERIPIVTGTLDGLPMRISVDTGSRSSLTLHAPFVRDNHLVEKYHAAPEAVMGWGVGGASRARPARFGTLTLGAIRIDGVAGDMYLGDKGSFTDPNLTGNLGGGVLKRFDVGFDYAKKIMYLKPNADAGKPDDFDRSGLWLLGDGDAFKVVDVAADSAALKAGMRLNDRILAIGGEAVGARSLSEWRERLRTTPAGTHLAIRLQRGGKEETIDLVLADRISFAAQP
ncbi:MAG TPA: aspartyl protease family protein [Xanthomonadaceae bacterium]